MFGSSILEVAIGVAFIYLLLSLICTAINEFISALVNKRGENLFDGIKNLLNDPKFTGLAQQLYNHGLVDGISQTSNDPNKPGRHPSYMPSKTFALALLDILSSDRVGDSWRSLAIQRQADLDAAQANLTSNKRNADLKKIYSDAQIALTRTQEILGKVEAFEKARDEWNLASKKITGPRDLSNLRIAKEKLGTALSLGRVLAVEFPDPLSNIQGAVANLPDGHTKQSLLVLIDKTKRDTALVAGEVISAEQQLQKLQENIEQWFNDSMDRVGGWYKRWTQWILVGIAFFLVVPANVDTIMLIQRFQRDNALRASIISAADNAIQTSGGDPVKDDAARANLLTEASKLSLPFGWIPSSNEPEEYRAQQVPTCNPSNGWLSCLGAWTIKLVGLIISIIAIQLGAPFWFDTLSKFVNIRAAGTPPGESAKSSPRPARKETSPAS
ncbi:MAG TPA: hypothetical protein VK249_32720 [Anaerolineales bacterium]|nr:hypothetical protein [Anaerolineales bacterium]